MTDELKPCPFCGDADVRTECTITDGSVWCWECGAVIVRAHSMAGDHGQTEAVAAWNKRTYDLIPRADAELAVAEAIRRAGEAGAAIAERTRPDGFPEAASNAYHSGAMDVVDVISSLANLDALAEVQRLQARVTSLSEQVDTIAKQRDASDAEVHRLREERDAIADRHARALLAGAEVRADRDTALARVEKLREALRMSLEGWENVLELDLLTRSRRHSAKTMATVARAALDEDTRHA